MKEWVGFWYLMAILLVIVFAAGHVSTRMEFRQYMDRAEERIAHVERILANHEVIYAYTDTVRYYIMETCDE